MHPGRGRASLALAPLRRHLLAASLLGLLGAGAHGAILEDENLQALYAAGRAAALQQAAEQKLQEAPDDVQAAAALALARLEWGYPEALQASVQVMQACIASQARNASCHYVLGSLLTAQAVNGGALKALSLAGRVRHELQQAFELAPDSYEARSALCQYYLVLPSFAGGSEGKARELEQALRKTQPEQARMLRVFIAVKANSLELAEQELRAVRFGTDAKLAFDVRAGYGQLGREYLKSRQFDKARALFQQLLKDQPHHALGAYMMSRLAHEQGRFDEAIQWLEKARSLDGAETFPLEQRIGNAYQDKGDKAQARAAYERYLAGKYQHYNNAREVRQALASLG